MSLLSKNSKKHHTTVLGYASQPPKYTQEELERDDRLMGYEDDLWKTFEPDVLAEVCAMDEEMFPIHYEMDTKKVPGPPGEDWFAYKDNGSDILAVAHLDTVSDRAFRAASFVNTAGAGPVVFSRALDDRLGAYTILEWLPRMGLTFDWLVTVGEESGRSTAEFFKPKKDYKWGIEFDRGGTDVVMYRYENPDMRKLVQASGAKVGNGSFSDIAMLYRAGMKCFNWGIGYRDYHGPRAHAYLNDTVEMVAHFMEFHATNSDTHLAHTHTPVAPFSKSQAAPSWWGGTRAEYEAWWGDMIEV